MELGALRVQYLSDAANGAGAGARYPAGALGDRHFVEAFSLRGACRDPEMHALRRGLESGRAFRLEELEDKLGRRKLKLVREEDKRKKQKDTVRDFFNRMDFASVSSGMT